MCQVLRLVVLTLVALGIILIGVFSLRGSFRLNSVLLLPDYVGHTLMATILPSALNLVIPATTGLLYPVQAEAQGYYAQGLESLAWLMLGVIVTGVLLGFKQKSPLFRERRFLP